MSEDMVILIAYMGGLAGICAVGVVLADYCIEPLLDWLERRRLRAEYDQTVDRR